MINFNNLVPDALTMAWTFLGNFMPIISLFVALAIVGVVISLVRRGLD